MFPRSGRSIFSPRAMKFLFLKPFVLWGQRRDLEGMIPQRDISPSEGRLATFFFGEKSWPQRKALGKSKGGLTNGGLSPKFSEKIGGNPSWKIGPFRGKLAPFQGWSGPFRGRSGPIPLHPTATGEEQKLPRKGPFWPDWPLSG